MSKGITLVRRVTAEAVGTGFLLTAIVGSGIMGEQLSGGNIGLALLCNAAATGAALTALILTFGSISGAHFNPVVTLADAWQKGLPWNDVPWYVAAQIIGGFGGSVVANLMFGESSFAVAENVRQGAGLLLGECVATFGLLAVIWGCIRSRADAVPYAVGAYVFAAIWFTSSTAFANPAVTLARMITNTFTGIRPEDTIGFIAAQIAGAGLATLLFRGLVPSLPEEAPEVLLKHEVEEVGSN